ncbi:MAG TPA: hypothetical protein VJZ01_02890 [Lachnospiraceae bacterium]|nr:hypothetical protein [Lachnospiraceae bacterium]
MRIMIFIEGTTFYTRPLLFLFTKHGYKPIGNAVKKVNALYDSGHEIYLCSYVRKQRSNFIKSIVDFYGMKYTDILCRDKGEKYSDIVEQLKPDILIEDDCKSIGGLKECCITDVKEEIKKDIQSIIVSEFVGIDNIRIN